MSDALAGNPANLNPVFELEPEQLYNVTAPIPVGVGNVTIKLSGLADRKDGSKPALIEVDTDESFAAVAAGAYLSLTGVNVTRSQASQERRRRRLQTGLSNPALVSNDGGTLTISGSELRSEDSPVLSSASGDITISSSVISGRVLAEEGKVTLSGSSFADSSPLVMAVSNAELVVGAGNSFKA